MAQDNLTGYNPTGFITGFKVPFIAWNRLEGRPRHEESLESIGMTIHDPLWMLSRQWQFGEFKGEDRGSAIKVKMAIESKLISHHANYESDSFADFPNAPNDIPLEVLIERLEPKFTLLQRADMGKFFLKKLKKGHEGNVPDTESFLAIKNQLILDYGFELPIEPDNTNWSTRPSDVNLFANKKAKQLLSSLVGKIPDGWVIFKTINSGLNIAGYLGDLANLQSEFQEWMQKSYSFPPLEQWYPSELTYKHKIAHNSEGGDKHDVMVASDYKSGNIDWYSFDQLNDKETSLIVDESKVKTQTLTVIPTPARYNGMPNKRLWEIEDSAVDFANFEIERSEIVKQILAEYAMVYSNDWFILPYSFSLNSRNRLKGMVVTDTFGINTLLQSSTMNSPLLDNESVVEPWSKWGLFDNDVKIDTTDIISGNSINLNDIDDSIFVAPTISSSMSSEAYEEVSFIRDEIDNRVWAVETRIFDDIFGGVDGKMASEKLRSYINSLVAQGDQVVSDYYAQLVYKLGDSVPENWIPFMAVRRDPSDNRSISLQRASMPRFIESGNQHIRPRNDILRFGLSTDNSQTAPFYINEEAISRSGAVWSDHYQRTRWHNGKTILWYGRKMKTSNYPVSSGLDFDNLELKELNQVSSIPEEVEIGLMTIGSTFIVR